jgi:hypothetical protein
VWGRGRVAHRVLVERLKGNRPLERPMCRWEFNSKMDIQEMGWGMDWIDLAQDRDKWRALMNTVMILRV